MCVEGRQVMGKRGASDKKGKGGQGHIHTSDRVATY